MAARGMILAVEALVSGYGSAPVLRNVRFSLARGEILGIVGHNGMGKTTLLRTLMGTLKCTSGSIRFNDTGIEHEPAHRRSRLGIGYVPQGSAGFPSLTVRENLELALVADGPAAPLSIDETLDLFPKLKSLIDRQGAGLSGGERQLLAMARAVSRSPGLLLLDELTEGVQPSIVEEISETLRSIQTKSGTSIVIVDQELAFVASLADRSLVMHKGQLVKKIEKHDLSNFSLLDGFSAF